MKKGIILWAILFSSIAGRAQEMDSTKFHLTFSYAIGLCGLLENNHAGNTYFSKYFPQISIGLRKELWKENNFISVNFTYTDRGTRSTYYSGNSFLPDTKFTFNNRYLALQVGFGIYLTNSWFLKETIGIDYLFYSNQYDLSEPHAFRGYYQFTPSFETSVGKDFNFLDKIKITAELMLGVTFLKTRYYYIGPRIGIFFKEKDLNTGYHPEK